jgi:hypothetical protein
MYFFIPPILGIAIATSIFGPALAYGIGGYFSRMYITLEGSVSVNKIGMR